MDYKEPEFMDFDAEMESKTPANDWKLVGRKQKLQPYKEATQTLLPASPKHQDQTPRAPITTPTTMATKKEGLTSSTNEDGNETETEYNILKVNNDALRITVRWRPTKYDKILADNPLIWCILS